MRVVDAETVHRLLDYPSLVEALRELFRRGGGHENLGTAQHLLARLDKAAGA